MYKGVKAPVQQHKQPEEEKMDDDLRRAIELSLADQRRNDVDNMSYEQILQMQDSVGHVSRGLTKD